MNYLITGAGSGIGRAITVLLASNGHKCFLLGRNEKKANERKNIIGKFAYYFRLNKAI